jgi:hypothetical protein
MLERKLIDLDRILPAVAIGAVAGNITLIFFIYMSARGGIKLDDVVSGGLFLLVFAMFVSTIPLILATFICGIGVDLFLKTDHGKRTARKIIKYGGVFVIPVGIILRQPALIMFCAYALPAAFVYLKPLGKESHSA